eukprot:1155280-Pelagomonas_calceolata.AAC.2
MAVGMFGVSTTALCRRIPCRRQHCYSMSTWFCCHGNIHPGNIWGSTAGRQVLDMAATPIEGLIHHCQELIDLFSSLIHLLEMLDCLIYDCELLIHPFEMFIPFFEVLTRLFEELIHLLVLLIRLFEELIYLVWLPRLWSC